MLDIPAGTINVAGVCRCHRRNQPTGDDPKNSAEKYMQRGSQLGGREGK